MIFAKHQQSIVVIGDWQRDGNNKLQSLRKNDLVADKSPQAQLAAIVILLRNKNEDLLRFVGRAAWRVRCPAR